MPLKANKRNIFKSNCTKTKRSGFAMVMAIGVIIVVSTIMLLSLHTTALTTKRTVDLYFYEQAQLHTKSAIEYALYEIAQTGCINKRDFSFDNLYDVNISMKYIGIAPSGCTDYINNLITPEQDGSVLMDVRVRISSDVTGNEPITFFRRTIQKL